MPIWLRRFYINQVKEYYEAQSKQMEEAKRGATQPEFNRFKKN